MDTDDRFENETRPIFVQSLIEARAFHAATELDTGNAWNLDPGDDPLAMDPWEQRVDPGLQVYQDAHDSLAHMLSMYRQVRADRTVLALELIMADYRYLDHPIAIERRPSGVSVLRYVPLPDNMTPAVAMNGMMSYCSRQRLLMDLSTNDHGEIVVTLTPADRMFSAAA